MDAHDQSPAAPQVGGPGVSLPDEHVGLNEATARDINEAIEAGRLSELGPVAFLCERGQLGCNATIELTVGEYEAVRSHPRRFVVVRGHHAHFDELLRETDRYTVVLKHGAPGDIADRTDPRADEQPNRA